MWALILKKFNKAINFFLHRIWHLNLSQEYSKFKNFTIREVQALILEIKLFYKNDSGLKASALAFKSLVSMVPILAVAFMFFKFFGGRVFFESNVKPFVYQFLTTGSGDKISSYIDSFLVSASVETIGVIGVIFLLIAAYSILYSIDDIFNEIWNIKRLRSFVDRVKYYTMIIVISPILLSASIALTSKIEQIGAAHMSALPTFMLHQLLPYMLIVVMFLIVFKIMPNCKVKTSKAFTGAVYATVLYFISKNIFVYYTKLAVTTNVIYGSLAIIPFFMLWLFFFWSIVLFSVHVVYVRSELNNLKFIERYPILNHKDKIRIAIAFSFCLASNYRKGKKVSLSDMADNLGVSVKSLRNLVYGMEQMGLIVGIVGTREIYLPAIAEDSFTIGKVIDAVDRSYISDSEMIDKNDFPVVEDVVTKIYRGLPLKKTIFDLIQKNDKVVAKAKKPGEV